MNIKNIKLSIRDKKDVMREFAEKLAKARESEKFVRHNEISFHNIETLRKILTEKRLEILHIVRKDNPNSIYELAKIANRDLKSINVDIKILSELGLISLEELKEERRKIKPKVEFDKLNIEVTI